MPGVVEAILAFPAVLDTMSRNPGFTTPGPYVRVWVLGADVMTELVSVDAERIDEQSRDEEIVFRISGV